MFMNWSRKAVRDINFFFFFETELEETERCVCVCVCVCVCPNQVCRGCQQCRKMAL